MILEKEHEKILKNGQIQKLRNEIRLQKLDIERSRNALHLATSELHNYEDLHLYFHDAEAALERYRKAVFAVSALTERLAELEG